MFHLDQFSLSLRDIKSVASKGITHSVDPVSQDLVHTASKYHNVDRHFLIFHVGHLRVGVSFADSENESFKLFLIFLGNDPCVVIETILQGGYFNILASREEGSILQHLLIQVKDPLVVLKALDFLSDQVVISHLFLDHVVGF